MEGRRLRASDPQVISLSRCLRSQFPKAFSEHAVEGGKWMDDVRERLQRSDQLYREHELAEDLSRTWCDKRGADQDSTCAVADQLQYTSVEIMDVASRRLG